VLQRHLEEQRLLRAYHRTRSRRGREAVIERFLPLARSLARRHRRGTEPLEDLQQVAFLALVKAVGAFDPSRGFAFTSFAVPSIAGAIKRHFRDSGWSVRMPRELQQLAHRARTDSLLVHLYGPRVFSDVATAKRRDPPLDRCTEAQSSQPRREARLAVAK
jgi:RNA polymerase sigma-B factor